MARVILFLLVTAWVHRVTQPAAVPVGGPLLTVVGLGILAAGLLGLRFLPGRSEEHTSELQSRLHLVCRLLLEKKKTQTWRSRFDSHRTRPSRSDQHRSGRLTDIT